MSGCRIGGRGLQRGGGEWREEIERYRRSSRERMDLSHPDEMELAVCERLE